MGGSGIHSAVSDVVGLCSRWEAGNLLQGHAVQWVWGLYGGDVGILYGPGIAGDAFRLLYRKSGGMVTSISS